MNQNELFSGCRLGKLEQVKYLVEEKEVELNVRDAWDSTPLYYACLCGHTQLVRYLLEHGARCEADTFDGERALYGALTEEIRQLLVHHKAITSQTMRRNQFEEFLRVLWENQWEKRTYSDITFLVHGSKFYLHRSILAARSPYFKEKFATKWKDRTEIVNNHPLLDVGILKAVMHYIYTGRLEVHVAFTEDCLRLAKKFRLCDLVDRLTRQKHEAQFFVGSKHFRSHITTLVVEPQAGRHELHRDLGQLACKALPPGLYRDVFGGTDEEDCDDGETELWESLADVVFVVHGERFYCHKVFFCSRSPFFEALVHDHFHETKKCAKTGAPLVLLHDMSLEAFVALMFHIYQDHAEISVEIVFEVLFLAELYLLPGLKKQCSAVIAENLHAKNVVEIVKIARQVQQPRLEAACVEFIAQNLREIVNTEDFRELVKADASLVKERQETDTIDIIDDIRYYVTSNVQTDVQKQESRQVLALIESLLTSLGLDG